MIAIKRILRYVKVIEDYGLWSKKNEKFELKVYMDCNWVGNIDRRQSESWGILFIGKKSISWTTKKKNCIFQSMVEAEYVATVVSCSNIVCIK